MRSRVFFRDLSGHSPKFTKESLAKLDGLNNKVEEDDGGGHGHADRQHFEIIAEAVRVGKKKKGERKRLIYGQ